jgi:hypothetical protein
MRIIANGDPLPSFDLHCSLLSLPLACDTTLETIPASIPYLWANEEKVDVWKTRLGNRTKFRIGLVWSGGPYPIGRSIPLEMISEVIDNSMEWYGLTRDIRDQDLDALKNITSINSLTAFLNDFSDTAAAIMNMDFIISVDTAVAHLAGALGKPVWILLPFHSDFRWLRDREDSPWYPTARLFRQTKIGDWSDVLERISKELDKLGING